MKKYLLIVLFFASLGCERNPVEKLLNPLPSGAVPGSSGIFRIYEDDLITGGGASFTPGGANQFLDFFNNSSSRSRFQIKYNWNGGPAIASSTSTILFAGFVLLTQPDNERNDAADPKDFSSAGYGRMTCYVRGNLSANTKLRIEGPDDGSGPNVPVQVELDSTQLTNDWQLVTLLITDPAHFASVKSFATISFQYTVPPRTTNHGEGGTVYFDDIRYDQ